MVNLIIKSSADNLVLQGSDASPAITVGATGTTTFAENATLSGTANNIGTVTAGSIAGGTITNATTFPAGHVVRTTKINDTPSSHSQVDSSTPLATGIILTTPAVGSGNYNRITFMGSCQCSTAGQNYFYIYANKNGAGYSQISVQRKNKGDGNAHDMYCMIYYDTSGLEAGTNLYQFYIARETSGIFYAVHGGFPYSFICEEIKG